MPIAQVFLSHQSDDKPLVKTVAQALGRRGIIPWLDNNELGIGDSLSERLKQAIKNQTAIIVFLSPKALKSAWVDDELRHALTLESQPHRKDWILPVYLGDPVALIKSSRRLRDRWLHPDEDRVDKLGIKPSMEQGTLPGIANHIANQVADKVYGLLGLNTAEGINIVIDQRGSGPRTGGYTLPDNIKEENVGTLVFRQDTKDKRFTDTLTGAAWTQFRDDLSNALNAKSLQSPNHHKVRIFGDFQLGLGYLLGQKFPRNTGLHLYCYNTRRNRESMFTNERQSLDRPLTGDGSKARYYKNCDTRDISGSLAPSDQIALFVGKEGYLHAVREYMREQSNTMPLVHLNTEAYMEDQKFSDSTQAMELVQDAVATITALRPKLMQLYCDIPANMVPLLAANLTRHVVNEVQFMEFNQHTYTYLPMQ